VFRLGWDAANERRYHDAVTEYSEAIRLKPDDPAVYNNRGAVYQILKQYHCGLQPSDLAETGFCRSVCQSRLYSENVE